MVAQDQFQNGPAGVQGALGIGVDHHAFHDGSGAGRSQIASLFHFDHADTAAGGMVRNTAAQLVAIAQSRNIDIQFLGGVQNRGSSRNGHRFAVDCKIYVAHRFTHPLTIAFFGQPSIQAPHLMHFAVSITCFCFSSPVIAPTGQFRLHLVHPIQASVMVSL